MKNTKTTIIMLMSGIIAVIIHVPVTALSVTSDNINLCNDIPQTQTKSSQTTGYNSVELKSNHLLVKTDRSLQDRNIQDFVLHDKYLVALMNSGISIYDMSHDLNDPIGECSLIGELRRVIVSDNRAYVVAGPVGFHIVDISSPENPVLIRTFSMPEYTSNLKLSGDYAYNVAPNTGLHIVRINPLEEIRIVGNVEIELPRHRHVDAVCLHGNRAYMMMTSSDLYVLDITNPADVEIIKHPISLPTLRAYDHYSKHASLSNIFYHKNHIYVHTRYTSEIVIIDVDNIENDDSIASLPVDRGISHITFMDNIMFVIVRGKAILIYDNPNPMAPEILGSVDIPTGVWKSEIHNGHLITLRSGYGLEFYEIIGN